MADGIGEGLDGLAERGEFIGDRDDPPVRLGLPVVLDHGSQLGVAVNRAPGDSCMRGDRGDRNWVSAAGEVGAGSFDLVQRGAGHPVWVSVLTLSTSRRAMSLGWRSAPSIGPHCSALRARFRRRRVAGRGSAERTAPPDRAGSALRCSRKCARLALERGDRTRRLPETSAAGRRASRSAGDDRKWQLGAPGHVYRRGGGGVLSGEGAFVFGADCRDTRG